jgi:hypothetical protein
MQAALARALLCEDRYEIPLWAVCTCTQRRIEPCSVESAFSQEQLVFFVRISLHT